MHRTVINVLHPSGAHVEYRTDHHLDEALKFWAPNAIAPGSKCSPPMSLRMVGATLKALAEAVR